MREKSVRLGTLLECLLYEMEYIEVYDNEDDMNLISQHRMYDPVVKEYMNLRVRSFWMHESACREWTLEVVFE